MASSNKTPHYQLSQFAPTDKPAWQGDYNSDMKKIDNGIYAAQNKADSLDASVSEAENKATQALEKAEAAEDAAENAAALAQEAKTTADNISGDLSGKVNKAGDTMTGPLVLSGDPTHPMEAATKQYVDQHGGGASGNFLPLSGGTMTGPITLAADPTSDMQAATKKYVDDAVAGGASGGSVRELGIVGGDSQIWTDLYRSIFLVNESLVLFYVRLQANVEISEDSLLFSIMLPVGYTMVETGILGVPGWCSSTTKNIKFDFKPGNIAGSSPAIQVVYSSYSHGSIDAGEQFYIFAMVQVRKS